MMWNPIGLRDVSLCDIFNFKARCIEAQFSRGLFFIELLFPPVHSRWTSSPHRAVSQTFRRYFLSWTHLMCQRISSSAIYPACSCRGNLMKNRSRRGRLGADLLSADAMKCCFSHPSKDALHGSLSGPAAAAHVVNKRRHSVWWHNQIAFLF